MSNNTKITTALQKFTRLPSDKIKHELSWGNGPIIKIQDFDNDAYAKTSSEKTIGAFISDHPNTLFLNKVWIDKLVTSSLNELMADELAFFIGVVILHEYTHYGDWLNGNKYSFPRGSQDEGDLFEISAFGVDVNQNNYVNVYFELKQ